MGTVNFQAKPKQVSQVKRYITKMDAANMSGTFMVSTSRRMSNVSSSSNSGSGSGMISGTASSYGSSYGSSAGSYMISGMKDMFKSKDNKDTMNGGLSPVHKYMSPPFWSHMTSGHRTSDNRTTPWTTTNQHHLDSSEFFMKMEPDKNGLPPPSSSILKGNPKPSPSMEMATPRDIYRQQFSTKDRNNVQTNQETKSAQWRSATE